MLFDQIAFKNERFELRAGDDRFEVGDVADQDAGFRRMISPLLKVGSDAVGQDCGLPDVEQITLLVPEQIDPWLIWQVVEFGLEFGGGSHRLSASSGQQGKSAHMAPFYGSKSPR